MPTAAGMLLLTGLLAQAHALSAPVAPGPVANVALAESAPVVQSDGSQGQDGVPMPSDRPHQVGVGGSMGLGSAGGGGAFRYFFSDQIGFNANIGMYRQPGVNGAGSQGSTFVVAPSMVYMLTKSKKVAAVDIRPYVGGGLNFATSSAPIQTATSTVSSRASGLGLQAFGGVEFTFQDAQSLAISAEVAHTQLAVSGLSTAPIQGTNFYLLFHYYVR